ncbi:MAG TPA: hypothetical protein VFF48_08610 [Brevundimonas sp.]|nr:hypothetical protein [Brevundimonas sp.]
MSRFGPVLAAASLMLAAPATAQERGPPPWAALTSPTAAMEVAFDKVCLAALMSGRTIDDLAYENHLVSVAPRTTGSPTAQRAWRLASWSQVYVMALPNGACSASVEGGDAGGLNAAAVAALQARALFTAGQRDVTNGAERTAWCTTENQRPLVAVLLKKLRGDRVAFLANVFRTQADRPPFCSPA